MKKMLMIERKVGLVSFISSFVFSIVKKVFARTVKATKIVTKSINLGFLVYHTCIKHVVRLEQYIQILFLCKFYAGFCSQIVR